MADKQFRCRLITPEARLLDEEAVYANIPLHDGLMGILPGRAPFVAKLGLGELRLSFPEGGDRAYMLEDGFGQMVGDTLTILAERCVPVEKLNLQEAEAELAEAQARNPSGPDDAQRVTKERARARLKVRLARGFQGKGI